MFKQISARRALFAAAIGFLASAALHADDQPRPGSFAAVMAVKDPSHFGPHLPAADLPSAYRPPVPGSIAAIAAAKDPSHYGPHLAAADAPTRYASPAPGSIVAVLAAKNPSRFGPHAPAPEAVAANPVPDTAGPRDCDAVC